MRLPRPYSAYFELANGDKVPIHDKWDHYEKVPFCGDFTTNENNTIPAMLVSSLIIIFCD